MYDSFIVILSDIMLSIKRYDCYAVCHIFIVMLIVSMFSVIFFIAILSCFRLSVTFLLC